MEIEFEGLEELLKNIRKLENMQEAEEEALVAAAEYLKDKIERNVYRTGLNRRTGKAGRTVMMTGVKNGMIQVGYSNQGNDAFYMYFHEYGTSKMPATPVVRPTFKKESKNIINLMSDVLTKRLGL